MPEHKASSSQSSSSRRGRPAIFGEVLFDHFPDGSRVLGGAPFNVAWHLRGFGEDPILVTAVGSDLAAVEIRKRMRQWGLSVDGVQTARRHPTGHVQVRDTDGGHRFDIPSDQAWDQITTRPARRILTGTEPLLYHGTLALRSERSWRTLGRLAKGKHAPPTFVDLNLRPPWSAPERIRWSMANAHWLKLNHEELADVSGRKTGSFRACRDAAIALARRFSVPRVIVTRGEADALCVLDARSVVRSMPPDVEKLVDTVGAGDAFSAVVFLGVLRGWSVQLTLDRAVLFAADICRVRGATSSDQSIYERHQEAWKQEGEPSAPDGRYAGLYVMSLSVHGLVRAEEQELGRDADTGGQVSYVVDQARALAAHPAVDRIDLVTRQIHDRNVDAAYGEPFERISDGAQIVRLPFGPKRYLRKESLWPHLEELVDHVTRHVRSVGRLPDVIHGHYADAGYVGAQLAKLLGVPFVFTGHSLGRVKRARLLDAGKDEEKIEQRYRLSTRIEAEERALEAAAFVVASTSDEVGEQYERYDRYQPDQIRVIPPGVDLSRFSPPPSGWEDPPIADELARFLADTTKPMILAIARPDERKNFGGLVRAFGRSSTLRARANLVIVAGNRDDVRALAAGPRRVLQGILFLIDRYDLYGSVAYPKAHEPTDVPDLYRLAARTGGVFVNPALTEPFGLTLIEAAASGLPVVATDDGGPRDIVASCGNGLLVDATDPAAIARGLEEALSSRRQWRKWSRSGVSAATDLYSWDGHASAYVTEVRHALGGMRPGTPVPRRSRLPLIDRVVVTDVDDTLTGDPDGVRVLRERLEESGDGVGFGIATGRSLGRAMAALEKLGMTLPDVLITDSGTQLHYGKQLTRDRSWERQIHHAWDREGVADVLAEIDGVSPGPVASQSALRLRYELDPERAPPVEEIQRRIRQEGLHAKAIIDHSVSLDVMPVRASAGLAIRFLAFKWDLPPERLLVAGDSGNDLDMLTGSTLGVVVGNHTPELEKLRGGRRVYFAKASHARGILEGIDWYDFFGDINPDRGADA